MRYIIHVNRQHIAMNVKGADLPVYIVREGNTVTYCRAVNIEGPSRLVYNGDQLSCGARAWIETDGPILQIGKTTFKEIRGGKS